MPSTIKFIDFPYFVWQKNNEYPNITIVCDQKHVFKRFRKQLKIQLGVCLFNFIFNGSTLKMLIQAICHKWHELQQMFSMRYGYAMNVPAMVDLFKYISDMSKISSENIWERNSIFLSIHKEIKFLGN